MIATNPLFRRRIAWLSIFASLQISICAPADPPEETRAVRALRRFFLERPAENPFLPFSLGDVVNLPLEVRGPMGRPYVTPSAHIDTLRIAFNLRLPSRSSLPEPLATPEMLERMEQGRARRRAYFLRLKDQAETIFRLAGLSLDIADSVEAAVFDEMARWRRQRATRMSLFEAQASARAATIRRLGVDPKAAPSLSVDSETLAGSQRLFGALTELFIDEKQMSHAEPPPSAELLERLKSVVRARLKRQAEALDLLGNLERREGTLIFHLRGKPRLDSWIYNRLHDERSVVEGILRVLPSLDERSFFRLLRVWPRCDREAEAKRLERLISYTPHPTGDQREWLEALAWWHAGEARYPNWWTLEARGRREIEARVAADVIALRETLELPPQSPPRRGPPSSSLARWTVAATLSLGLALAGGLALGLRSPEGGIPVAPLLVRAGPDSPLYFNRHERGGNYERTPDQRLVDFYEVFPAAGRSSRQVPLDFEVAYLNGPIRERTPVTPRQPLGAVEFEVRSTRSVAVVEGWLAAIHVPGFDTVVRLSDSRGGISERDFSLWRTEEGTLLVKLERAVDGPIQIRTEHRPLATRTPSTQSLTLRAPDLDRLADETIALKRAGLTALADAISLAVEKARSGGGALSVTDLAKLVASTSFYTEIAAGRVLPPLGSDRWSSFRELPREEGRLVLQCSSASAVLQALLGVALSDPMVRYASVDLLRRDADELFMTMAGAHRYTKVWTEGFVDHVVLDPTPSQVPPRYRRAESGVGKWPDLRLPFAGLVGAGLAGVAARWFLNRGKKVEAQAQAKPVTAPSETEPESEPVGAAYRIEAEARSEDPRLVDLAELSRRQRRMLQIARSLGTKPDSRDRSLPLPLVSEAVRAIREFVLDDSGKLSQTELAHKLGERFSLSDEALADCAGSLRKTLVAARDVTRRRIALYRASHPKAALLGEWSELAEESIDSTLEFLSSADWAPPVSPSPAATSCAARLKEAKPAE